MFEISNNKIVGFCLGVLLALIFLSNTSLAENSNHFASFDGNAEHIYFDGEHSDVKFKAKRIELTTNSFTYYSIKNVTIQDYNGDTKLINNTSRIKVQYTGNFSQDLRNVDVEMYLNNISMTKNIDYNRITIDGYYYSFEIKSNDIVYITDYLVDYVIIDGMNISNYGTISFETDNSSTIKSINVNQKLKLKAHSTSDLKINSKISRIFLYQANGIFGLNDHKFNVKSTDILDVEIIPNYQNQSVFIVDDTEIKFYGTANSAKLNNENIVMGDISYLFKEQPEKIMAIAAAFSAIFTAILLFLTALNYDSARKLLSMETDKKKHEMQRFLNILLAELETNSLLLEDLKNSLQTIIDDFIKINKIQYIVFRDDGFNTFRNQGGFEYITPEIYNLFVEYYNLLYKLNYNIDLSDISLEPIILNYINKEVTQDIEDIETRTN
ncbi:MAG: hypothetical protein KAT05_13295, partial [Spirochaetes bacterium]|nr:hypothetical protein [Spirochaetota bacterium]